jgi:osmotically-inducible protein OsmY
MIESKESLVKKHLVWDNRVTADDIEVSVTDSTAQLSGKVSFFYEKRVAEQDALSVEGIESVENNLEVVFPDDFTAFSDKEIEDTIDNILMYDSRIDSRNIDVRVNTGLVTLDGNVDAFWKKYVAEDIALNVSGVVDVTNNLIVVRAVSYEDEKIAEDIRNAIDRSLINPREITIDVSEGVVTLGGVAQDSNQKRVAYEKATYTAGVTEVINNIRI